MNTYYLAANSSDGYISFFDEYSKGIKKIIVLRNITKNDKSKIYNEIINLLDNKLIPYDLIIRTGYINEIDAISLTYCSTIIVDEHLLTVEPPHYSYIVDFYNSANSDLNKENNIINIKKQIIAMNDKLSGHLKSAKIIHDDWEKIYISNIDIRALNNASEKLISDIFENCNNHKSDWSNCNRFFGTMLPRDSINYIDMLTHNFSKRILIKGRPGCGKSTLLKKILNVAHDKKFDTETYHCSFDVNSLDMVIIRELGLSIFDSTAPHEIFPAYDSDTVFDIYDIAIINNPDSLYEHELIKIKTNYNAEISKAKECLYTISLLRNKLDLFLASNMSHIQNQAKEVINYLSLNN